ncbi:hypothetical protein FUSPEROL_00991 [Fusobacterium periodonticum ATCC 33693]|uniref:Glycosyltransferase RgtA/B/C/D-like domain-containing protein n=2 Tax=Fusobacterium periodonticum TaxID=860 RepID=D4CUB6_9FUSO|nr:hypothetical protein FUSPEROL_00991 [Fusobacterium periodonticum ATCC 33693]
MIGITIVFRFGANSLNEDNGIYAIEELNQFNNEIFNGNIGTMGIQFSPRYYANLFMAYIMKIFSIDWFESSLWLIRVNYILYLFMIIITVMKLLKKNRLLAGLILSLCIMNSSLISISFGLNLAPDVFLGTAAPLSFLALVCVLGKKKYWLISWILVTISTFLHIHEGFWGAFLLGVMWIATSYVDKKINVKVILYIIIYLFFLAMIVVPPIMNSHPVDSNYFTQIYVYIRTPHHLLLSYIGKRLILKATILLLFVAYMLHKDFYKYQKYHNIKRNMFIENFLIITYIFLYIVHYFSTEIFKIPFITTLYIPKSFKFFTFLAIISYIILGLKRIEKKLFFRGIIFLIIPIIPNLSTNNFNYQIVMGFVILSFILEKGNFKIFAIRKKYYKEIMKILTYLIIFLIIHKNYYFIFDSLKFLYVGILFYEFIFSHIKLKKIILVLIFLIFLIPSYNSVKWKLFKLTENGYQYISGLEYAKSATDLELYELAKQFKNITSSNEEFLSDPFTAYSIYFQLFSERNSYVIYKNMPSQKHLVIQWYERVQKVKNISELNEEELKRLLKDINIKYILLTEDRFNVVEESNYFEEVIKNKKYGIFKLKEN